jgi:hypothetical protein
MWEAAQTSTSARIGQETLLALNGLLDLSTRKLLEENID